MFAQDLTHCHTDTPLLREELDAHGGERTCGEKENRCVKISNSTPMAGLHNGTGNYNGMVAVAG